MPEQVTYDSHQNLVIVKSTGHLSKDEVRASILKVADYCKKNKTNRVFVDQKGALSFPKDAYAFNLGSDVAHILRGIKIAIVYSQKVKENIMFFEKVIQKRGGNLKVFSNVESAKNWLGDF